MCLIKMFVRVVKVKYPRFDVGGGEKKKSAPHNNVSPSKLKHYPLNKKINVASQEKWC